MEHICTNDSLLAGGEHIQLDCFVCNKRTKHKVGYGGMKCTECGVYMFDFDDFTDIYKKLKNGRQRKEIAQLLGLKPSTVSSYQGSSYGLYKLCHKIKEVDNAIQ